MKIMNILVFSLCSCILIGCENEPDEKNDNPQNVIAEPQLKALEKAKGVEQSLLDAEQERRKEMEKQGG